MLVSPLYREGNGSELTRMGSVFTQKIHIRSIDVKLPSVLKRNDQGPQRENQDKRAARVSPGGNPKRVQILSLNVRLHTQTPELFYLGQGPLLEGNGWQNGTQGNMRSGSMQLGGRDRPSQSQPQRRSTDRLGRL